MMALDVNVRQMELILLAIIASLLSLLLLEKVTVGEDPVLLFIIVPALVIIVAVGAAIVLGLTWAINFCLEMLGVYLG
jgi:hypothetical protein